MRATGWQRAKVAPLEVAKRLDATISKLAGVSLDTRWNLLLPDKVAEGSTQSKIQSPTRYAIEYHAIRNGLPTKTYIRADGLRKAELEKAGWKTQPVATARSAATGAQAVENWMLGFPRAILAPISDKSTPFTALVSALASGKGGYTLTLDEREVMSQGQVVHNYRLVAERSPAVAKKIGASRIEIVSDAHINLPVTILVSQQKPGQTTPTKLEWIGVWRNNRTFEAKNFVLAR